MVFEINFVSGCCDAVLTSELRHRSFKHVRLGGSFRRKQTWRRGNAEPDRLGWRQRGSVRRFLSPMVLLQFGANEVPL
jgi:hypothetical protein